MPLALRTRAVVIALIVTASFAGDAFLFGQSIPKYSNSVVTDIREYTQLDWVQASFTAPDEIPAAGPKPLLVFADLLDLRGRHLRFAGSAPPRQAMFVAHEIILGNETSIGLRGQEPVTWPPAAVKAAEGKEVFKNGGHLFLIADTLRIDGEPAIDGLPFVLRVDASGATASGVADRGDDGSVVVAFRRLILSDSIAQELCRARLESADLYPADASGHVQLEQSDRLLLAALFDPKNPFVARLRKISPPTWTQAALRDEIQRACAWDIEQAAPRVVRSLLRVENSYLQYPLSKAYILEHEVGLKTVVNNFAAFREVAPIGRALTLWSIAYFKYLNTLLNAAASRNDLIAVSNALDRFEKAPNYPADPALADEWKIARNRLRRALAYYRPKSPGNRIVSRLPPNVMIVESRMKDSSKSEPGCAFVVGRSDDGTQRYLVTAGHVVKGADSVRVSLFTGELTPRLLAEVEATVIEPRGDVEVDLALLAVAVPPQWSEKRDVDGDSAQLAVGSQVWSISTESGTVLPALDAGTIRIPGDADSTIEVDGVEIAGGNSGCPLVADSGIVGMLIKRTEDGNALALPITLIRETVREHWDIRWILTASSVKAPAP